MYERILLTTDGSEAAKTAFDHAIDIAARRGATLHVLYVVDTDAIAYSRGDDKIERLEGDDLEELPGLQERARQAIETVVDRAREAGVETRPSIRGGAPYEAIPDYAEEHDIDLIVMGSHGRSGAKRMLLGSVTERILRSTTIPVLVTDARGATAGD